MAENFPKLMTYHAADAGSSENTEKLHLGTSYSNRTKPKIKRHFLMKPQGTGKLYLYRDENKN